MRTPASFLRGGRRWWRRLFPPARLFAICLVVDTVSQSMKHHLSCSYPFPASDRVVPGELPCGRGGLRRNESKVDGFSGELGHGHRTRCTCAGGPEKTRTDALLDVIE